ncbi:hypothetical protein RO3G_13681 [Rhizopus delemar RA 99-880]|uniref:Uncharacterized protein n=1 Tax=Rhizopus delemar (strain RA 99-880 / ATCC MYA-4621 / FGSC 9543 / NRRL 43880) TaxID=246409 RepID=I1CKJ0_RHIO9|nr:hypothetical protein RO3G_13681 [Rhizopus delemar RA 99-880]|eukprot:EIE88970.1 hypothetical protein RO3G_13681 [Rhizopus delemar RA 99-880]
MTNEGNGLNLTPEQIDALYAEFARRQAQEQEEKQGRNNLPVEIITELDNVTEQQQEENFKRFRRDTKRYEQGKWTTPERINSELYREIGKHKSDTSDVISKIYEITETTRFQAKVATEIFEQLQYVLQQAASLDEARTIIHRTTEQSKRLAIFGLSQAKNQERIAKNYAIDALNIPASIRYLVPKKENYKSTNAFSDEFLQTLSQARFEQELLQRQSANNNRSRGRGNNYGNNARSPINHVNEESTKPKIEVQHYSTPSDGIKPGGRLQHFYQEWTQTTTHR